MGLFPGPGTPVSRRTLWDQTNPLLYPLGRAEDVSLLHYTPNADVAMGSVFVGNPLVADWRLRLGDDSSSDWIVETNPVASTFSINFTGYVRYVLITVQITFEATISTGSYSVFATLQRGNTLAVYNRHQSNFARDSYSSGKLTSTLRFQTLFDTERLIRDDDQTSVQQNERFVRLQVIGQSSNPPGTNTASVIADGTSITFALLGAA